MSINREVAERLIENLQAELSIKHDQSFWLTDHKDLFVVSPDDRWSCATSGCAAGYIFLQEGEPGLTFDMNSSNVYPDHETAMIATYWDRILSPADEEIPDDEDIDAAQRTGINISEWAGKKLGIWDDEIDGDEDLDSGPLSASKVAFLFYQFGTTQETINRIRFLLTEQPLSYYDSNTDY